MVNKDQSALPKSLLKPLVNECVPMSSVRTFTFWQDEIMPVKRIASVMMISFFMTSIIVYFINSVNIDVKFKSLVGAA